MHSSSIDDFKETEDIIMKHKMTVLEMNACAITQDALNQLIINQLSNRLKINH